MSLRNRFRFWGCVVGLVVACAAVVRSQRVDYREFLHRSHVVEQKLACESCHRFPSKNWKAVRKGDEAFPDIGEYPEHKDCLNCHRAQFFARERPAPRICKNCHVNATPNNTARLAFPSLGRSVVSEFVINFPEVKHADQEVRFEKGTTLHAGCFMCHSQESELAPLPQSCGSCHRLPEKESRVSR